MSTILVPKADAPQLGLEDLKHLMRAVNETTERLEGTHLALQEEVARLQRELAEANAQLRRSRALAALMAFPSGLVPPAWLTAFKPSPSPLLEYSAGP